MFGQKTTHHPTPFERPFPVARVRKSGPPFVFKRPDARIGRFIGTQAIGSFAVGALTAGAVSIGSLAIGRLVVRRFAVREGHIKRLQIDELEVGHYRVVEQAATVRNGQRAYGEAAVPEGVR